jgi:hypothetical protein
MVKNTNSGPGTCTKCSKHLADLLDHINKRHRDDRFQQEELTDSGLIACSRGKVVLNDRFCSITRSGLAVKLVLLGNIPQVGLNLIHPPN